MQIKWSTSHFRNIYINNYKKGTQQFKNLYGRINVEGEQNPFWKEKKDLSY